MCKAHDAVQEYYKNRKKKKQKRKSNHVKINIGRFAGFKKYADYLRSSLWKKIRIRVMNLHSWKCGLCSGLATQVHHRKYDDRTMSGETLKYLFPVCKNCHLLIEFYDDGSKRTSRDAELWLKDRINNP